MHFILYKKAIPKPWRKTTPNVHKTFIETEHHLKTSIKYAMTIMIGNTKEQTQSGRWHKHICRQLPKYICKLSKPS